MLASCRRGYLLQGSQSIHPALGDGDGVGVDIKSDGTPAGIRGRDEGRATAATWVEDGPPGRTAGLDQEFEEGLKCIGAPIRDRTGTVVAAISVAGPAMRLKLERMPRLIDAVLEAAARLSTALGYRQTPGALE